MMNHFNYDIVMQSHHDTACKHAVEAFEESYSNENALSEFTEKIKDIRKTFAKQLIRTETITASRTTDYYNLEAMLKAVNTFAEIYQDSYVTDINNMLAEYMKGIKTCLENIVKYLFHSTQYDDVFENFTYVMQCVASENDIKDNEYETLEDFIYENDAEMILDTVQGLREAITPDCVDGFTEEELKTRYITPNAITDTEANDFLEVWELLQD